VADQLFYFLLNSCYVIEEEKFEREHFMWQRRKKNQVFRLKAHENAQKGKAFARPPPTADIIRSKERAIQEETAYVERMEKQFDEWDKEDAEIAKMEAKSRELKSKLEEDLKMIKKQDFIMRLRSSLDFEIADIRSKARSGSYEKKMFRKAMVIESYLSDAFVVEKINAAGKLLDGEVDASNTLRALIFDEICSGIEATPASESPNFSCVVRCVEDYPEILPVIISKFPELLSKRKNILAVVLATVVQSTRIPNKDSIAIELQKLFQVPA
jgi:hypothetical protein